MATKRKQIGAEKYLIIRVDPETHRALKLRAVTEGTSMQRLAEAALVKIAVRRESKGGRP
jgi:predicted HicB family RNase H-like nuclease